MIKQCDVFSLNQSIEKVTPAFHISNIWKTYIENRIEILRIELKFDLCSPNCSGMSTPSCDCSRRPVLPLCYEEKKKIFP